MKKTRKFAALLVAVMCVSGMGAMSAFAADTSIGSSSGNATINEGLYYTDDSTNNYIGDPTWNITVTTDALVWEVYRGGVNNVKLTWTGSEYTIDDTSGSGTATQKYTLKEPTSAQNVAVTNNCNFPIASNSTFATASGFSNPDVDTSNWFTATDFESVAVGGSGNISVAPKKDDTSNEYYINEYFATCTRENANGIVTGTTSDNPTLVTTMTVSFRRVAESSLAQYNGNSVTDNTSVGG